MVETEVSAPPVAASDANVQVLDLVLQKGTSGLGFTVIDDASGVLVHSLKPGGAAQGILRPDDKLLFINKADVRSWQLRDIVSLLKNTTMGPVQVTVARKKATGTTGSAATNIPPSLSTVAAGATGASTGGSRGDRTEGSAVGVGSTIVARLQVERQGELGVRLAGGQAQGGEGFSPIVVAGIDPNSPAADVAVLKEGDTLVAVNGQNVGGSSLESVQALLSRLPPGLAVLVGSRGSAPQSPTGSMNSLPAAIDPSTLETLIVARMLFARDQNSTELGFTCRVETPYGINKGVLVVVSSVQEGSAAHRAGLRRGHMVLSVNDAAVSGITENELHTLTTRMANHARIINMVLAVPKNSQEGSVVEKDVVIQRNASSKNFGLRFTDRLPALPSERGIFIEDVLTTLQGENVQLIEPGMLVCAINGVSALSLNYKKAIALVKQSGSNTLRLKVTPVQWPGKAAVGKQPATAAAVPLAAPSGGPAAGKSMQRQSAQYEEPVTAATGSPNAAAAAAGQISATGKNDGLHRVVVDRSQQGLGFGITGGQDQENNKTPVVVGSLLPTGPAASKLMIGDQLLWVSGVPLPNISHQDAVNALKAAPNSAEMIVLRGSTEARQFMVARFFRRESGLGISIISSTADAKPAVFVRRIVPGSAAAADGTLKRGDRVLAVGPVCLLGLSHDQAVKAFQTAPPEVVVLVERYVNGLHPDFEAADSSQP